MGGGGSELDDIGQVFVLELHAGAEVQVQNEIKTKLGDEGDKRCIVVER